MNACQILTKDPVHGVSLFLGYFRVLTSGSLPRFINLTLQLPTSPTQIPLINRTSSVAMIVILDEADSSSGLDNNLFHFIYLFIYIYIFGTEDSQRV